MDKLNIKTGDTVQVISGRSKGGKGKVAAVSPKDGQVIIEGVNLVTKHVKPKKQNEAGGIVKVEGPVRACKVMVVCPKCGKLTRVAHKDVDGKKIRCCKKCSAEL